MLIENLSTASFDELAEFLRGQFPRHDSLSTEDYCRWRYLENPLAASINDCLVARHEGRIVAFLGAIADRIGDADEWRDCRWLVNFIVAPEHRGGLLALRLFQRMMQQHDLLLATGVGEHMRALYQSLNWRRLPVGATYYRVRRPSGLMRLARDKQRASARFATQVPLRLADLVFTRLPPHRQVATFHVELGGEIEELTDFLASEASAHGVTTWRDQNVLSWKCEQSETQLLTAISQTTREVAGYVLVKPIERSGIARWLEVVDLLTASGAAVPALLCGLDELASQRDVDFIRLRCSCRSVTQFLRKPYWWQKTMPISDDVFLHCRDAKTSTRLESGPWYFTSLMSDRAE